MSNKYEEAIKVEYISSACIITSTPDVIILHDPWFTDGAFDGSWFTFPKISNPIEILGDCDFIFISHIHSDHFDPEFLNSYFSIFGIKTILIANFQNNYLAKSLQRLGFKFEILSNIFHIGNTSISIYPFITKTQSILDIDSFIILDFNDGKKNHRVINLNDCNFSLPNKNIPILVEKKVDILLVGYLDASSYPQCYFDKNDKFLIQEKLKRINDYLLNFKNIVNLVNPVYCIPFAGEYILGGKLSELNYFRAIPDALDAKNFIQNGIVLESGGYITTNYLIYSERTKHFTILDYEKRIMEIKKIKMPYENFIKKTNLENIPFEKFLKLAAQNLIKRSEIDFDYYYEFIAEDIKFIFNINKEKLYINNINGIKPSTQITLSKVLLFGLLIGRFNWNNMLVGSHLKIRRNPNYVKLKEVSPYTNDINRKISDSLNFFTL